jgi:hypothetical protein
MRLPSFRLPKTHASAIYLSTAPLFDFALGAQPVANGAYRNLADGAVIGFETHDDFYRVSGDATPETVALVPIASRPDTYVFQQSAGRGTTFYGALLTRADEPGFRLFSPESIRDEAIRTARSNGATLIESGCLFTTNDTLLAALVPLVATAPPHCWNAYRRD